VENEQLKGQIETEKVKFKKEKELNDALLAIIASRRK
jgi:hypothetical protein